MTTENLEGLLEGYYLGCGSLPPQDLRTRDESEIETKNQSETPHTLRSEPLPLVSHQGQKGQKAYHSEEGLL